MELISNKQEDCVFKPIVSAIQKAIEEDFPNCCQERDYETNNHRLLLRGDLINDNLRQNLDGKDLLLLRFDRFGWKARLVVDKVFKRVFCVVTESTINRLKAKGHNYPHYSQTLVQTFNKDLVGNDYQPELFPAEFSSRDYEYDMAILSESGVVLDRDFHFYYIVFSAKDNEIKNIRLLLLDDQFTVVEEKSLIEFLMPEYPMVSNSVVANEKNKSEKDASSLVSIKPGVIPRLIEKEEEA